MGKGQAKILLPYPKEITGKEKRTYAWNSDDKYRANGIMFEREVLRGWRKLKTLCKMLARSNMDYSVKYLPRLVLPKTHFLDDYRQDEVKKRQGLTAIVKWKEKKKK